MKTKFSWIISLLVAASLLLSACAAPAATTEAPPPPPEPAATTAPEPTALPEPTAVPVEPATPDQLDAAFGGFLGSMTKYNTISLEGLSESLADNPKPFILDVRQPSEVEEKGHIEGAVLIPLRELGANLDKLPSFDTPIISYCGSGWRCTIAMTGLSALGWENVTCLKDGSFGGWAEAGNPVAAGIPAGAAALDAAEPEPALALTMENMFASIPEGWGATTADELSTALAETKDLVLIDVRTEAERQEKGTIEGALAIPLEDFVAQRAEWPADPGTPIAVYCGSGHRSTIAMSILWAYGYQNVISLKNGYAAWLEAGLPVEGGQQQASALVDQGYQDFLAGMVKYNTIGLDDLNVALAEDTPPYLLDVRTEAEIEEKGHIPGAVGIPLRELAENLDLLPAYETPIVVYCGSGWRATIAMTLLGAMGWQDVKALKENSYSGWVEAGYATEPGMTEPFEPLNAALPDPALVEMAAAALAALPENYGGVAAGDLATELIENPGLILIDARTQAERQEKGSIAFENQLSIPIEEFLADKAAWPADPDARIVVYCGSGHRSTMAMTILNAYGYSDVRSVKGGFAEWLTAELPVAEVAAN